MGQGHPQVRERRLVLEVRPQQTGGLDPAHRSPHHEQPEQRADALAPQLGRGRRTRRRRRSRADRARGPRSDPAPSGGIDAPSAAAAPRHGRHRRAGEPAEHLALGRPGSPDGTDQVELRRTARGRGVDGGLGEPRHRREPADHRRPRPVVAAERLRDPRPGRRRAPRRTRDAARERPRGRARRSGRAGPAAARRGASSPRSAGTSSRGPGPSPASSTASSSQPVGDRDASPGRAAPRRAVASTRPSISSSSMQLLACARRGRRSSRSPRRAGTARCCRTTSGRRSTRASATRADLLEHGVVGTEALRDRDLHPEDTVVDPGLVVGGHAVDRAAPPRAGDRSPPAPGRRSTSPSRASRPRPVRRPPARGSPRPVRQSLREQRRRRPGTPRRTRPPTGDRSGRARRCARRTGTMRGVSASAYAMPASRASAATSPSTSPRSAKAATVRSPELEARPPDPRRWSRSCGAGGPRAARRATTAATSSRARPARDPRARRAGRGSRAPSPRTSSQAPAATRRRIARSSSPRARAWIPPRRRMSASRSDGWRARIDSATTSWSSHQPDARPAHQRDVGEQRLERDRLTGHGGRHLVVGTAERGQLDEAVERVAGPTGPSTCSQTYSPIVTPVTRASSSASAGQPSAGASCSTGTPRGAAKAATSSSVNRRSSSRSTTASRWTARRATPTSGNVRDPMSTCALPGSRSTSPASSATPSEPRRDLVHVVEARSRSTSARSPTRRSRRTRRSSSTSARGGGSAPNCASSRPARRAALASAGSSRRWTSTPKRASRFSRTAWAIRVVLPNPAPATIAVTGRRPATLHDREQSRAAERVRDRDRRLVEDAPVERGHRHGPCRPTTSQHAGIVSPARTDPRRPRGLGAPGEKSRGRRQVRAGWTNLNGPNSPVYHGRPRPAPIRRTGTSTAAPADAPGLRRSPIPIAASSPHRRRLVELLRGHRRPDGDRGQAAPARPAIARPRFEAVTATFPYATDLRLVPFWGPFGVRPGQGRCHAHRRRPVRRDVRAACGSRRPSPTWPAPTSPSGYRWWTAAGARRSLADDGLTFGTNADRGVCVHFHEKVPSRLRRAGHSAITVTVADPDALVDGPDRDDVTRLRPSPRPRDRFGPRCSPRAHRVRGRAPRPPTGPGAPRTTTTTTPAAPGEHRRPAARRRRRRRGTGR